MKTIHILMMLIISATLASCTSINQPKDVVEKYLASIDHFDHEKAESFLVSNSENLKSIENIKNLADKLSKSEKEKYTADKKIYQFEEKNLTANSATVTAIGNQGNYPVIIEFHLVKDKELWKIEKFSSN